MSKQLKKWEHELWDDKYTPETLPVERIMDSNDEERLKMILWTLLNKKRTNRRIADMEDKMTCFHCSCEFDCGECDIDPIPVQDSLGEPLYTVLCPNCGAVIAYLSKEEFEEIY